MPPVVLAMAIAVTAGCGSDDSSGGSTEASVEETTAIPSNELIGRWSTENVCEDELRAFQEAGAR